MTCAFCEGVYRLAARGRPARFCSKTCRQADYRERAVLSGTYAGTTRKRADRRRHARERQEFRRLRAELVEPTRVDIGEARAQARKLAREAWPFDGVGVPWPDYVARRPGPQTSDENRP